MLTVIQILAGETAVNNETVLPHMTQKQQQSCEENVGLLLSSSVDLSQVKHTDSTFAFVERHGVNYTDH